MEYIIKHVTNEQALDRALALDEKVFGESSAYHNPAYSREKWLERMRSSYNDCMLYAQAGCETIGIVFGHIESNRSITIGPVAVNEQYRKHGIARKLMLLLEKRAAEHGINLLTLGAAENAEGFYEKLGYTGSLLIQSEKHSIYELLSLNTKYKVNYTRVYDGTVNQVNLALPCADRALQSAYEATLPGCHTLMMFCKRIEI